MLTDFECRGLRRKEPRAGRVMVPRSHQRGNSSERPGLRGFAKVVQN